MNNTPEEEAAERLRRAVQGGAEIVDTTFGAVVLMGGPVGAGAGAAAGSLIGQQSRTVGLEVIQRHLSPREARRVGAVVAAAAEVISERIKKGAQPQTDGFFDPEPPDGRSSAEEIAEGVLIAAQREHQEKKIKHMGYLPANVAFLTQVDREQANHLVRLAEELFYRQLCIIQVESIANQLKLKKIILGMQWFSYEHMSTLIEVYDLYAKNLVTFGGKAAFDFDGIDPSRITLFGSGVPMNELMELHRIDQSDVHKITQFLR